MIDYTSNFNLCVNKYFRLRGFNLSLFLNRKMYEICLDLFNVKKINQMGFWDFLN